MNDKVGDRRTDRDDPERWRSRTAVARAVRLIVLLAPVAVCVGASFLVTRLVPAPSGVLARIGWLLAVIAVCSVLAWPARRLLRRLLPLAALLEMSMLFPGEAPTRWRVARKAGAIQHLQILADGVPDAEPVKAATTILALVASLTRHDKITRGHSERVRILTDMVSEEMGLPRADRDRLRWAALIHDIGKLEVPSKLLRKPGKPTASEWAALRMHPEVGARLATPLFGWLGEYAAVVLQHHERYDGTGYPAGLRGDEISLGARIVGLTDAFEVMTAARPYKKAWSRTAALREVVRCSGTHFDPVVVRALLAVSTPRLRRALGPASWVGQLPVLATAPVGGLPAVAGTVARGAGAAVLGGVATAVVVGATGAASASPEQSTSPHVQQHPTTQPTTASPSPQRTATVPAPRPTRRWTPPPTVEPPRSTPAPSHAAAAPVASKSSPPPTSTPSLDVSQIMPGQEPKGTNGHSSEAPGHLKPTQSPLPLPLPLPSLSPSRSPSPSPSPITGTVSSVTGAVGGTVDSVTGALGDTVGSVTQSLGDAVGGSLGGTVDDLGGTLDDTISGVGDGLSGLLGGSTSQPTASPTPSPTPTSTSSGGLLGGLLGGLFGG